MKNIATSSRLKTNYEDYYESGDPEWRRLGAVDKCANIVSLCRDLPHETILEIGAGDGAILKRLSELGFGEKLHALEISPSGVEAIKNKGIPNLVECLLFDGYELPYNDFKFDLAVLSHVIEHVEYPRKLLYEAARVARHVFVEVPLEDTLRLKPNFVFDKVGHINFYSPVTFRRLVQTCSLEVLKQTVTNPSNAVHRYRYGWKGTVNYYIKELLLKIFPRLATKFFVYHSSLVCRAETKSDSHDRP
ncbi:MAG: class I SAM-dependent methyltransferase [Anaerolineales bacterium]|nr:class I SAM-dependent methyltransferase [Anaerolineales bacterium]